MTVPSSKLSESSPVRPSSILLHRLHLHCIVKTYELPPNPHASTSHRIHRYPITRPCLSLWHCDPTGHFSEIFINPAHITAGRAVPRTVLQLATCTSSVSTEVTRENFHFNSPHLVLSYHTSPYRPSPLHTLLSRHLPSHRCTTLGDCKPNQPANNPTPLLDRLSEAAAKQHIVGSSSAAAV